MAFSQVLFAGDSQMNGQKGHRVFCEQIIKRHADCTRLTAQVFLFIIVESRQGQSRGVADELLNQS